MYRNVFPVVHHYLSQWQTQANVIPNQELRKQALMSIQHKTFHCEGGAVYGLLAGHKRKEVIQFIVAYQTISDYLDNLCDRSTSFDPVDFRMLHQSMYDALTPTEPLKNYYCYRKEQDDGGYLHNLVTTCQQSLDKLPHFKKISNYLCELEGYYSDLQVHKHVKHEERRPRLENWFENYQEKLPPMSWYEFSACAGSTLGIFCLVAYAAQPHFTQTEVDQIRDSYFPYIQGLHILLDYFIDQEEDKVGGDLNFCFYYSCENEMKERFSHFIRKADDQITGLPNETFHRLINRGLLGLYLSDGKVNQHKVTQEIAKDLRKLGGRTTQFFYQNGKLYRFFQSKFKGGSSQTFQPSP